MPDLEPFFARYESLLAELDTIFIKVGEANPGCVKCAPACSDCCHALFDLSLIEAMYINKKFTERFAFGPERSKILENADEADRQVHKIKRRIFKESKEGKDSGEIMAEVSRLRQRCPLLGPDDNCLMYDARPATCRVYGIPTRIGQEGHCCPRGGFKPGVAYPALEMDKLAARLEALSAELAVALKSSFKDLHKVFVPLSLALLTRYDAEYLGIKNEERKA